MPLSSRPCGPSVFARHLPPLQDIENALKEVELGFVEFLQHPKLQVYVALGSMYGTGNDKESVRCALAEAFRQAPIHMETSQTAACWLRWNLWFDIPITAWTKEGPRPSFGRVYYEGPETGSVPFLDFERLESRSDRKRDQRGCHRLVMIIYPPK